MLSRLAEYASRKAELAFDEQVEVACLIGALQLQGVITPDNHNGLLIVRHVAPHIKDGQHRTLHWNR